ncbi:MAG: hypothetical protein ACYSSI_08820 [Planctomycetota bacterium]
MPRQFGVPEELIQKVFARIELPSVYSPYLSAIHDKHVIGVNNAYQIGPWIDVLFFGDCGWYLVHRKKVADFPGLKITCCKRFTARAKEQMEGVKHLQKDGKHRLGLSPNKQKIGWNSNSGAAAINLAIHFGAKRIILLGFDMKLDGNKVSHWHGSHGNPGSKRKPPPFSRHLKGFPMISQDAERLGIEIINANPESAITVFKKVTMQAVLVNSQKTLERVA